MRLTYRQKLTAVLLAFLLHVVAGIAIIWKSPPSGAKEIGLGGIEVSLGPAGGAPGTAAASPPAEVQSRTSPETPVERPSEVLVQELPEENAERSPELQSETPPEAESTETVPPLEPEPARPTETAVEPPPIDSTQPEQIVEAKPVHPPPRPKRKPEPPEPRNVAPLEFTKVAPPEPQRAEEPQEPVAPRPEVLESSEPVSEQIAAAPPSTAGAAGKSGTQDKPDTGNANDTSGGGAPGAAADYMSYLLAWLQKHKEYPRTAQRRRQQGTALLYFEMDRHGEVHDFRLKQSSGHRSLDREVLALIRRAAPLPAPPPEVEGARIKLVVPVQFFLK